MESWFPQSGSPSSHYSRFGTNSVHPLLSPPAESREWAVSNVRIKKQRNSPTTGRPASRTIRATAMGPTPRRSTTPASASPPFPTTTTSTAPPHRGWRCSEGSTRPHSLERWGLVEEQVSLLIFGLLCNLNLIYLHGELNCLYPPPPVQPANRKWWGGQRS